MNKRTASKLQSVTEFWNEWQLILFVSSSLFLQIMLGVLGSRRKYTSRNWLRYILWLAYSLAYRIAAVSIAIISNDLGYCDNPSQQIRAFWAPFLLLHLGGPDTITAYSSEDNALRARYFLGLFTHFVGADYIFLGSWKATPLNILAILMFKAGLIKYLDRTFYLMSRSNARFTKFVIRWLRDKGDKGDGGDDGGSHDDGGGSDEEPGDAAFMAGYYFKKAEGCYKDN
ncbi:hypothetical protein VitviT2T_007476 [Vitis vinifera]|uniref:DUF4220 domain-containing protein n=2 Tax=Vitis vinifera TaxID=29760 RepID=F6HYU9_VITVI|nr:hypothetical protein VitviT2T_007476 [Vitis vinifera]